MKVEYDLFGSDGWRVVDERGRVIKKGFWEKIAAERWIRIYHEQHQT